MASLLEKIFGTQWPDELWQSPRLVENADACRSLFELPELEDRRRLFGLPGVTTRVYYQNRRCAEKLEHSTVTGAIGLEFYERGFSVAVEHLHKFLPQLGEVTRGLASDLGVSACSVSAFMGPPGDNVPAHTDPVNVMVVQLSGTKRWTVAPPRAGGIDQSAETFELGSGSVLFVPRDHWHQTRDIGTEPALSLSFIAELRSWADLWGDAMRHMLSTATPPLGVAEIPSRTPTQRRNSTQAFLASARVAMQQFAAISLGQLLPPELQPRRGDRFICAPAVTLRIESAILYVTENGSQIVELAITPIGCEATTWFNQASHYELGELQEKFAYSEDLTQTFIALLLGEGFIRFG